MVLHFKKIEYRIEEVKPGIGQIDIFKLSGQKQLPVIKDDNDQIISDSSNICEYIDKKNDTNSLFPEDPILFAQSKIIEDWADTTMASACKKVLITSALENPQLRTALLPDEIPSSIKGLLNKLPYSNVSKISKVVFSNKDNLDLQKNLEALSKALANKQFLVGNSLSIADISIAAQLSLLKFPVSSGPILAGEGCHEFINNPYLENLFDWRDNLEELIFNFESQ
tara:strand:- start:307 stop:981 length:675 start_codon:yes stop_codon:yes gene_type:complete